MRAIIIEHPKELGSLRELPAPEPGEHEIQIAISVAGVNPVDWKIRDSYEGPFPFVLGQDFAGRVTALGAGVTRYAVGDRVFGIARPHGAYAEYTVVAEDSNNAPTAKIPDDVGDADAAGLPTAGLTALACVERMGVKSGDLLFIAGITGSVGQFAAQIARTHGVRLAGSGSSKSTGAAERLGLEAFFAYDQVDVAAAVRERFTDGVDALLDLADKPDGVKKLSEVVKKGGIVSSTIRTVDVADAESRGLRGLNVNLGESPQSSHDGLRRLVEMVERGEVHVPMFAERNLTDAVQALELQKAGGASGKILITI